MELENYKRMEDVDYILSKIENTQTQYSADTNVAAHLAFQAAKIEKIKIQTLMEIRDAIKALCPPHHD